MPSLSNHDALVVDFYELTMAAGYLHHGYNPVVTFELFVRYLPDARNYLVAAGIRQAVDYILDLKFDKDEIAYLKSIPALKGATEKFFEFLSTFKFSGDVWAVEEGEILFANEPILQIRAPLIEAQLLETFLLTSINFQTMIASKAARVVQAAQSDGRERLVMEFGSRRAHGPGASVLAARAAFLAGCDGTSNVLAGYEFNIPVFGTTAHSWTLAFESEQDAFRKYNAVFPDNTVYLIDTFDVIQGLNRAIAIGKKFAGIRIDSGDLEKQSKQVRKILDENNYQDSRIILSGDLNEYRIRELVEAGTPVDSFGVGTQIATSADAPYLAGVYKLVERESDDQKIYLAKFSEDKMMLPGRKQVFRYFDGHGMMRNDEITLFSEARKGKQIKPLLNAVIVNGDMQGEFPELSTIRKKVKERMKTLPEELKSIDSQAKYRVDVSSTIKGLTKKLIKQESKS